MCKLYPEIVILMFNMKMVKKDMVRDDCVHVITDGKLLGKMIDNALVSKESICNKEFITKQLMNREFELIENQSTYIPKGEILRLENQESTDLEIIEIQTGEYLGEDDIIRLEDEYERN